MNLRFFQPSRLLAPYVTAIWDYEDLSADDNLALSILPDTATYLCFLYADLLTTVHQQRIYTIRSGLAGFQSFRSDLGTSGKVSGVSARLTPWGLNVFCPGVVRDCADKRVDCRDIFPKYQVEAIEDQLAVIKTPSARAQYLEHFLLSILNRHNEDALIQTACKALDNASGNYPIAILARTLGLTERTFERRFQVHVGTTPKKYARIVRLRHAIFLRKKLFNWADVAYAAGYYDQSHMINDFQTLYGVSPESLYPQITASQTIQFSGLLNLNRA